MNQLTEQEPALVVEAPSPSDWQSGELLDFLELQRGVDLPVQDRRGGDVPILAPMVKRGAKIECHSAR